MDQFSKSCLQQIGELGRGSSSSQALSLRPFYGASLQHLYDEMRLMVFKRLPLELWRFPGLLFTPTSVQGQLKYSSDWRFCYQHLLPWGPFGNAPCQEIPTMAAAHDRRGLGPVCVLTRGSIICQQHSCTCFNSRHSLWNRILYALLPRVEHDE